MIVMIVQFHRSFDKKYGKLREGERRRSKERILMFQENPFQPILNNHPLRGKYRGRFSINVGGDLRAIYIPVSSETVLFVDVDTHHNLFGS